MLRELWSRLRTGVARGLSVFARRRDGAECFILLVLVSLLVFLLRCLVCGSDAFLQIFHLHGRDLLLDFFNSVCDAAQGARAYTERHVMYPPMANLLLLLLSRLFPEAYLNSVGEARLAWYTYPGAVLAFLLALTLSLLLLVLLLQREPYSGRKRAFLSAAVVLSFPLIFLLERGNTVLLCLSFLLLFMQCYESENRTVRELGLLSLAFATSIKLYPVLFAAVLLGDRRYRELVRLAVYVLLMLLIPSFFFGGPVSILRSLFDVLGYSGKTSLPFVELLEGFGISAAVAGRILIACYALELLLFALSAFLPQRRFVTLTLAAAVCMTFPSIFSAYNWVLFLPALLLFFRTERLRGMNWLYFLLLTLPFCLYIPKAWQDDLIVVVIGALLLLCIVDNCRLARRILRERREKKGAETPAGG